MGDSGGASWLPVPRPLPASMGSGAESVPSRRAPALISAKRPLRSMLFRVLLPTFSSYVGSKKVETGCHYTPLLRPMYEENETFRRSLQPLRKFFQLYASHIAH